jgi:hypothetical protein
MEYSCKGNFRLAFRNLHLFAGVPVIHSNPCRKKDDTIFYEKRYKIIVGSATDMKYCL